MKAYMKKKITFSFNFSLIKLIVYRNGVIVSEVKRLINFQKRSIDLHAKPSQQIVVSGKPRYVITGEIHMSVTIGLSISKRHFR